MLFLRILTVLAARCKRLLLQLFLIWPPCLYLSFQHPRLIQCIYTSARHWFWIFFWAQFVLAASRWQLGRFTHPISNMERLKCRQSHPDPYTLCKLEKGLILGAATALGQGGIRAWVPASLISTAGHTLQGTTDQRGLHWTAWDSGKVLQQTCLEQLLWVGQHARCWGTEGSYHESLLCWLASQGGGRSKYTDWGQIPECHAGGKGLVH